jgi:hypothetical protein
MEKAESITLDEARELVGDAALWPRMRDFLWDFAPQVHESWMEPLKVEGSTIQSPRVKAYILESLGVEPFFHDFPKDDWSRLALLDGATLIEIAKWLGALACAEELRRVTNGATVRELKTALRGVYPEVFGFTAYFGELKAEKLKVESLTSESVVMIGMNMLLSMLPENPSLLFRLKLKLPKTLTEKLSTFNVQTLNIKLPSAKLRLLLKLRYSEAYSLCCS